MNQREAKRMACRCLSNIMGSSAEGGPPIDESFLEADQERLNEAWEELIDEMWFRGQEPESVPR